MSPANLGVSVRGPCTAGAPAAAAPSALARGAGPRGAGGAPCCLRATSAVQPLLSSDGTGRERAPCLACILKVSENPACDDVSLLRAAGSPPRGSVGAPPRLLVAAPCVLSQDACCASVLGAPTPRPSPPLPVTHALCSSIVR